MHESEEDDEVDELLPTARTLLDRLVVVMHAQTLRYIGILAGLGGSLLAVVGFGYTTFGHYPVDTRLVEELHRLSPLLFIASTYSLFLFCMAYYRSSIDRLQVQTARRRLNDAIAEALELSSSG